MFVRKYRWVELNRKLDNLEALLRRAIRLEIRNMALADDLVAAAERARSVDDSIEALLDTISQQLKDVVASNGDLPALKAAVQDVISGMDANTAKVQEAVVRNTPVTPAESAATS